MALPTSFKALGAVTVDEARIRRKLPRGTRPGVLIKNYGPTQSGKTEFALSCPGPGILISVDKQSDAVWDNSNPPAARNPDWGLIDYEMPVPGQSEDFVAAWKKYRDLLYGCINNKEAMSVCVDGDSETWDLQLLADHGKVTQIMPIKRTGTNQSRRALMSRLYFSGKIVICTHRVKPEYEAVFTPDGKPVKDSMGNDDRRPTGRSVVAGFNDDNYLWHLVLEHFKTKTGKFGIKIIKCKANTQVEGMDLVGDECNFASLVQVAYPDTPLKAWGL